MRIGSEWSVICFLLSCCSLLVSASQLKCEFGEDKIAISDEYSLPAPHEQEGLMIRGGRGIPIDISSSDLPIRKDVEFERQLQMGVLAKENGQYTRVTWQNVGYFLSEVTEERQFRAIIALLHECFDPENATSVGPGWTPVSTEGYQEVMRRIATDTNRLPFKISPKQPNDKLLSKGVFRENDRWHVNVLCLEDASLVEYKYVMTRKNRIGRMRRVVIEGVANPLMCGSDLITSNDSTKEQYRMFQRCRAFLCDAVSVSKQRPAEAGR